jgi:hypothetical protein
MAWLVVVDALKLGLQAADEMTEAIAENQVTLWKLLRTLLQIIAARNGKSP